jgi:hypothetical protein
MREHDAVAILRDVEAHDLDLKLVVTRKEAARDA